MLQLKKITKTYVSGDEKVEALKGVDIEFRESEFVSILGQSGCGKTTLLNIIGGLDRYTKGDLIINGKSTKDFKDRDWDSYRNYSIGFVFQSYNLISHQTVLSNVELALTIAGVSKKERKERAIKALEEVGLKDQIYKKPNQLSGGQMQRVAIARALVNNPDIILADEPTGALDSKTSEQVMEILKKISKDKLIIMVTHNSELAEKYSSRIIKIVDGKIIEDSNPIENEKRLKKQAKVFKKTSMKFFTALRLSLNNLLTKKARTILTAFAGSIGIIGIALILAISTGVQDYIDKIEEDTLSSYPLTIEDSTVDMGSMMATMMGDIAAEKERKEGKVYSVNIMDQMLALLSNKVETNNLKELKKYIEETDNEIKNNSNAIQYNYNLNLNLYNPYTSEKVLRVNPSTVMDTIGMGEMFNAPSSNSAMSMLGSSSMDMSKQLNVWTEMLDNEELLKEQYDLLAGKWPENYNEVVFIVVEDNETSDYVLYTLGLKDQDELKEQMKIIQEGGNLKSEKETSYTYEELLDLKYKLILNSDYYEKENGIWLDKSDDEEYMKKKVDNAEEISIVGIIKQNEQSAATGMAGGIGYTKELKEYVINKSNEAEIVKEQIDNPTKNIFSGLEFPEDGEEFNMNSLTQEQRMQMSMLSSEELAEVMKAYTENANASYDGNMEKLGAIDLDNPTSVNIYPKDFESKEAIEVAIEEYNKKQENEGKEENTITYTDIVGTMISSVSKIVDIISYVLIAFVAISLVVSSIMIGIITYISVLERTKEIGILRAIGVSKKDVSRIFNAETLIVGLIAGLLGIGITVVLTIPINAILLAITGVVVTTRVPFIAGVILVIISVLLTIIGGLIPSKLASKKDPVIALRTE
ncbi:MAG: ABC transporter ATP-binding protein/permease [Clostridia bacterium]|nr:ABC transporter ATP-binding protein/permease [Clostridia bacterium]